MFGWCIARGIPGLGNLLLWHHVVCPAPVRRIARLKAAISNATFAKLIQIVTCSFEWVQWTLFIIVHRVSFQIYACLQQAEGQCRTMLHRKFDFEQSRFGSDNSLHTAAQQCIPILSLVCKCDI